MTEQATTTDELAFIRPYGEQEKQILTAEAVEFLTELVTHFTPQRNKLLAARIQQQQDIDNGTLPDFISETASIRDADWKIRGIPADLEDRRVEITGPVERKMVINALNANVKVFMADFEDSLAPDWNKVIDGQINLRDAVNGTISYTNEAGKIYQLKPNPAVLICRVRGLHLPEKHVTWRGEAIPGSLFDFALYFFHNYQALLAKGSGPYFYLPKTQSWQEAAWWSEVFSYAEDRFNLPRGTIKATLLIETLPAVFQMDEILHALRDHIVGLNCGRWDYIFSYIKTLKNYPDRVLPDRQAVTMDKPFLNAYSRLLIKTCHKRGAFAMGGMAAFIPSKDEERNNQVLNKVKADKSLEAKTGFRIGNDRQEVIDIARIARLNACGPLDLIGTTEGVVDPLHHSWHRVCRIERLIRIHAGRQVSVRRYLPSRQIDCFNTRFRLLQRLTASQCTEAVDVAFFRLAMQQTPHFRRAQLRQGAFRID